VRARDGRTSSVCIQPRSRLIQHPRPRLGQHVLNRIESAPMPTLESLYPLITLTASIALIWLSLTAITTPGTGAPEIGTLISLIAVAVTAFLTPIQPAGLLLLLAALGCFIAALRYRHLWVVPLIAFALQFLGSFFLLPAPFPLVPALLLINLVSVAYFFFVIRPGLQIQNRPDLVGAETLIGARGVVVRTLDPLGSIKIDGAVWRARADRLVPSGTWVRVLSRDGLELLVTPSSDPYHSHD
jgi:membrane-bound serine protease (ClpP class)